MRVEAILFLVAAFLFGAAGAGLQTTRFKQTEIIAAGLCLVAVAWFIAVGAFGG